MEKSACADRSQLFHIGSKHFYWLTSGSQDVVLEEDVMKKVIFAVLLTALALFLVLPSLSWAF